MNKDTAGSDLVHYKVLGNENSPTVYYLVGYGGTIKMYMPHIKVFLKKKFRVVAFEYDKRILSLGQPELIVVTLKYLQKKIDADTKTHKVAGLYGVSIGSWFGWYVTVHNDKIKKGVFNSGGDSITRAVMQSPTMKAIRAALGANNIGNSDLEKIWGPYDIAATIPRSTGTDALLFNGKKDKIVSYTQAKEFIKEVQKTGGSATLVSFSRHGHMTSIVRAMFYKKKTIDFLTK